MDDKKLRDLTLSLKRCSIIITQSCAFVKLNNFLTFHPTDWSSGGVCSNSSAQLQRILVVDDDPAILRLVKDKLNRTGFEVFTTTSGQRTLDVIDRRGLPHLAIVDIMMPGMDGFEFRRTY